MPENQNVYNGLGKRFKLDVNETVPGEGYVIVTSNLHLLSQGDVDIELLTTHTCAVPVHTVSGRWFMFMEGEVVSRETLDAISAAGFTEHDD